MKKTSKKIVVIGAGTVGTSFLYSAINQGIASEYVLIDHFCNVAEGNAWDLSDAAAVLPTPFHQIKVGDYSDLKDADLVVITAGRSQQSSLEMTAEDVLMMQQIAQNVRASGFDGVSLLATNPVDVMSLIYQQAGGFDPHQVIGSGTTLDSARLRRLLASKLGVHPSAVNAYLMGEQHGASAVAVWSHASVSGQPIASYVEAGKISWEDLEAIRGQATKMAYQIINFKKATFYGIGVCLTRIAKAVLNDEKTTLMVSAKVGGQYQAQGIYIGVPAVISQTGWTEIIEWKINAEEQNLFLQSVKAIQTEVAKISQSMKVH